MAQTRKSNRPDPVYLERISRLFDSVPRGVGAVVVSSGAPLRYFTGLREGSAVLRPRRAQFVTHRMFAELAEQAGWPVMLVPPRDGARAFRKVLRGVEVVGYHAGSTTCGHLKHLRRTLRGFGLKDVSAAMAKAAKYLDDGEISCLRKACRISARTAAKVPSWLRTGMTELELARLIDDNMARLGSEGSSQLFRFGGIVAFGPNASHCHHPTGHTRLKKGDFVLVDFGADIQGYDADITRTFVFGKASPRQKRMYQTVADALRMSLDMARERKPASDIHKAVGELFHKRRYGDFIHGIGHAIGLLKEGFPAEPRCCVTIEPGIYIPGFGGVRIEEDVLFTERGMEVLTRAAPWEKLIEV